jgi:hypothetical protein
MRYKLFTFLLAAVVFPVATAWACYSVGDKHTGSSATRWDIHCDSGKTTSVYLGNSSGRYASASGAEYSSFDDAARASCGCN